jgi:hypothetical protein
MKQVAQQEAERSKFVVMKTEQERIAAVVRAEGESDAARLISDATMIAGPVRRPHTHAHNNASEEAHCFSAKDPLNSAFLDGGVLHRHPRRPALSRFGSPTLQHAKPTHTTPRSPE